ncbi:MAG: tryptophan synthase subunit alpha [bacterium]
MNRIEKLEKVKGKKLIIYLMAGDPDMASTQALLEMLCTEGVSLIEIGIPFSDPIADGKTIQLAGERALKNGADIDKTLKIVKAVRKKFDTPMVFMTYYNIIYKYGFEKFIANSLKAGLDGAIIPDRPYDEDENFGKVAKSAGYDIIYLTAPTSSVERARKMVEKTSGFLYYILVKGTTGVKTGALNDYKKAAVFKKMGKRQVFAGFGISKPEQVKEVLKYSDGVIVGSAFVKIINENSEDKKKMLSKARNFVKKFSKEVFEYEK